MPNIDPEAKSWQLDLSERFGRAVAERRKQLGITAVQLSERTRELGYPVTRSSVARIEGNHRAGKVDMAEVLVLSAALKVPPLALIYPVEPNEPVQITPGFRRPAQEAALWFDGESYDGPGVEDNDFDAEPLMLVRRHAALRDEFLGVSEAASDAYSSGFQARAKMLAEREEQLYKELVDLRESMKAKGIQPSWVLHPAVGVLEDPKLSASESVLEPYLAEYGAPTPYPPRIV